MLRRTRESTIERQCVQAAEADGWSQIKISNNRSWPDRLFWKRRTYVWVEMKRTGGKPRPQQLRTIQRLNDQGEHAFYVDTLEGFVARLNALTKEA